MTDIQLGHHLSRNYQINSRDVYPKLPRQHQVVKMKDVKRLSKLELLQEDYRSRLLHEKEQKLNALFEQRMRANTLPKRGSVREFFINRRMVATSTNKTRQNPVILPAIEPNSRYEGVRLSKMGFIDGGRLSKVTKFNSEQSTQYSDKEVDELSSELAKLRKRRRRRREPVEYETKCDPKPTEEPLSSNIHQNQNQHRTDRTGQNNCTVRKHPTRSSQEKEVYKRAGKLRSKETSQDSSIRSQLHGEQLLNGEGQLSRSLAKIKALSRRKTEEFILRSMTAKTSERKTSQPLPRTATQKLDEMCKLEMELRETISRERKKLGRLLQQRKQEAMDNTMERSTDGSEKPRGEMPATKQPMHEDTTKADKVHGIRDMLPSNENQNRRHKPTRPAPEPKTEIKAQEKLDSHPVSELSTCANCGRSFMKERIVKHENACRKASARKKKPFDTRKKRAEGTEMAKYLQNKRGANYATTSKTVTVTALL